MAKAVQLNLKVYKKNTDAVTLAIIINKLMRAAFLSPNSVHMAPRKKEPIIWPQP